MRDTFSLDHPKDFDLDAGFLGHAIYPLVGKDPTIYTLDHYLLLGTRTLAPTP